MKERFISVESASYSRKTRIRATHEHTSTRKRPVAVGSLSARQTQVVQYRQVLTGMKRITYELRHGVAYVHMICNVRRDLYALMLQRILDTNPTPSSTKEPRFDYR